MLGPPSFEDTREFLAEIYPILQPYRHNLLAGVRSCVNDEHLSNN